MRLCILQPNHNAYSETFIARQIRLLQPVKVLYEGWYPTVEDDSGRSFLPFPARFLRGLLRSLLPGFYSGYYTRQLEKYFRKNKIDYVLANYGPMGVRVMEACRAAGIPLVVHFHGFDAHHHATLLKFGTAYKRLFELSHAVIAVSGDMKASLLELGAPEDKIWFNPYAVDAGLFRQSNPAQAGPVFVFVGRFAPKKNPLLLLRSFQQVVKEVPEARLVFIGEGGLLEPARALATELNIAGQVEFAGRKNPGEVAAALQQARAFVQHSLTAEDGDMEGTPNTILEASSSGLPVVSTAHAGIKEAVIHEKTGFLVPEGDWEGMARYMIRLARDPVLAQKLGEAGRKHILAHYNSERQENTFKEIFVQST